MRSLRTSLRATTESADEMFNRLRAEGQHPRGPRGFMSRVDFVEQENQRRLEEASISRADRLNKVLAAREGILGQIARGVEAARNVPELDLDTTRRIRQEGQDAAAEARAETLREKQNLEERLRDARANNEKIHAEEEKALREEFETKRLAREKEQAAEDLETKKQIRDIRTKFDIDNAALQRTSRSKAKARQEEAAAAKVELARLANLRDEEISDIKVKAAEKNRIERSALATQTRNALSEMDVRQRAENSKLVTNAATQRAILVENARKTQQDINRATGERIENLPGEIEDARRRRFDFPDLGPIERGAAKAVTGLKDLARGFSGARQGIKEFLGDAGRAQGTMVRLGASFGEAASGASKLINVRWLFLISIIQVLLTLLINVGAALVAIAASAITAGAALGGALAAGAAQALPVIGLLAAAMNKLEGAMKVVELRDRARDTAGVDAAAEAKSRQAAIDGLADAQYNLAQSIRAVDDANEGIAEAHQRVTDAVKDQADAIAALADARKDAARAIVDAALNERDANLSLREAEIGVLEAKEALLEFQQRQQRSTVDVEQAQAEVREAQERLRIARSQGDQDEISTAVQQLSIAQQNVSAIKDQAAEAQQNEQQLQVSIERANLNVEQARIRQTRAAEENKRRRQQGVEGSPEVGTAKENIVQAERQHANAVDGVKDAEERRADALHNVAIAQRGVARAQASVVESGAKQSAAARNAQREFDQLSAGQKELVLSIEALKIAWNSPEITGIVDLILVPISNAIRNIIALLKDEEILGAFRSLATEMGKIVDRFSEWTISPQAREFLLFFIREATLHLPGIATAMGDFGIALLNIAKAASPVFTNLLERLGGWGKELKGVTNDTERMDSFFERAGEHLNGWIDLVGAVGNFLLALTGAAASEGLSMVENLTNAFNNWADWIREHPKKVEDFFKRVHDNLRVILPLIGEFIAKMVTAFTSKQFQEFTVFITETMLPVLLTVIEALATLARIIQVITELPVVGPIAKIAFQFLLMWKILTFLLPSMNILRGLFVVLRVVALAFIRVGLAFLIANPWVAAILAVVAVLVLVVKHWDKVKAAVKIAVDFIINTAKRVVSWFRDNWKDVLFGFILAPFTMTGKLAEALIKFGADLIGKIIEGVVSTKDELWKAIRDRLGPLGKVAGIGKTILELAIPNVPDPGNLDPRNWATGGVIPGSGKGDIVPAMLTPGEWVLNKSQQMKLAVRLKQPVDNLKMWLFGTAGKKPNGQGEAAPVGTRGATRPAGKPVLGPGFKLHPHEDDHGVEVWFVELADGKWGQVTKRAAERIAESGGAWMPGYVRRANAFATGTRRLPNFDVSTLRHFAGGGEVQYAAPGVGSFASGGTTINSGSSKRVSSKTVNNNFEVQTASPTIDIDYIMRVAGMHAEASF